MSTAGLREARWATADEYLALYLQNKSDPHPAISGQWAEQAAHQMGVNVKGAEAKKWADQAVKDRGLKLVTKTGGLTKFDPAYYEADPGAVDVNDKVKVHEAAVVRVTKDGEVVIKRGYVEAASQGAKGRAGRPR